MSDLTSPTRPRVGATGFGSTMADNTRVGGQESSPSSYQTEANRFDSLKGGNTSSDATYGRSMPVKAQALGASTSSQDSYVGSSARGLDSSDRSDATSSITGSSNSYQGPARGSGSSLEDKATKFYNSVAQHPQMQQLTQTGKQVHQQYIQPVADKVLTAQTQQQLRGQTERLRRGLHQMRHQYDRSFFSFVEDVVHTKATPTLLGLITWLLTFELVLPMAYFTQSEARYTMMAAFGTIMASHAIWYLLGRQIRPLVLGGFAVQIPLFLYLMFSGGLGGGYASGEFHCAISDTKVFPLLMLTSVRSCSLPFCCLELALAIDAAQRSVKHAGEIATLSNYYYVYILWVRAVMVGSAVVLSHAAPAIRNDLIAYRRGQVATGSLNTTSSLQAHSAAARSLHADGESTSVDRYSTSRRELVGHNDAGGSNTIPSGTSTRSTSTGPQASVGDYLPSQESMNKAATTASNIASSVANTVSNMAHSAINTASNNLPSQSRVNEMKEQVKETAAETYDNAKAKAQETSSQLSDKASDLSQRASHQANRAYEQAPSTSDMKAQVRSAADTVSSKASEVSNAASNKASEVSSAASNQASRAYEQTPSAAQLKDKAQSATSTSTSNNQFPSDSFREYGSSSSPAASTSRSAAASDSRSNMQGLNALTKDESVIGTGSSYGRSTGDSNTQPPEQNPDNFTVHQPQMSSSGAGNSSRGAQSSSFGSYEAPKSTNYQSSSPSYAAYRSSALSNDNNIPQTSYSGAIGGNSFDGQASSSRQAAQPRVQVSQLTGYSASSPSASRGGDDSTQSVRQVASSAEQPRAAEHKYTTGSNVEGDVNDKRTSTTFALNPMVTDHLHPAHGATTTSQAAVVDTPFDTVTSTTTQTYSSRGSPQSVRFLPYESQ